MLRKILLVLLAALVLIQFFHPKKNTWDPALANNHSISTVYNVPSDVHDILAVACNDCHSNNTRYPWYNNIQPVTWWLNDHINEGKREINFDEFATYEPRRQYNKLKEVEEQIKKAEMPLDSYTWIHRDAILTEEQKRTVVTWSEDIRKQMEDKYPPDSLKRKPRPGPAS